jgi:hypothetical protein
MLCRADFDTSPRQKDSECTSKEKQFVPYCFCLDHTLQTNNTNLEFGAFSFAISQKRAEPTVEHLFHHSNLFAKRSFISESTSHHKTSQTRKKPVNSNATG